MSVLSTVQRRPAAPPQGPTPAPHPPYHEMLARVRSEPDPQKRAILHDHLARSVANHLQQAGHKVSWKGEHLMVDGRPYVIAGQDAVTPPADAGASGAPSAAAPAAPQPAHAGPDVGRLAAAGRALAARHAAERDPARRAALASELQRIRHHLTGGAR